MSAIAGTRRSMKELVDGTIRVSIDIDPIHRAQFFAIFSQIDMPVAIAPLVANFERQQNELEPTTQSAPIDNKQKGGELAKWAGILCNDPMFWEWMGLKNIRDEDNRVLCAANIREVCKVSSRSELDHDKVSGETFRIHFMQPFSAWKEKVVA